MNIAQLELMSGAQNVAVPTVSVEANLRSKLSPNGAAVTKTARVGGSV